MQRGAKDFAKKASVNAEKSFLMIFWVFWREEKIC